MAVQQYRVSSHGASTIMTNQLPVEKWHAVMECRPGFHQGALLEEIAAGVRGLGLRRVS